MLESWFETVQLWPSSVALRESLYGYTLLLTLHVVSLTLFAGVVLVLDLRLTGLTFRNVRVSEVWSRMMLPWMTLGLLLNAGSGALLVYSNPMRYYVNFYFWVKAALFVIAGVNAIYFHLTLFKTVERWEHRDAFPTGARVAGLASVLLWSGVLVAGRLLAYEGLAPAWWLAD